MKLKEKLKLVSAILVGQIVRQIANGKVVKKALEDEH